MGRDIHNANAMRGTLLSGPRFLSLDDPATGAFSRTVSLADGDRVHAAIGSARHAFDTGWNESALPERIRLLEKFRQAIAERHAAFAATIAREVGSPIDFARAQQVDAALNHIDATLDAARQMSDDLRIMPGDARHRIRYEAAGVAALITPWNWPLNQAVLKISGALAAGCTIVLKPSELTPDTSALLLECAHEAGIPDGTFNLVIGDGEAGRALAGHRDIDIVSFTGSTAVGRAIAVQAAERFKPVILELGGKSANLLFADCDLETAVRQGVAHCFRNAGQSCNAASRMLVERSVYTRAVELAAQSARQTRVGLPGEEGPHIGPLISAAQYERVQRHIATGIGEGARLVAGGPHRPDGFPQGYFVRPTVFADVAPAMTLFKEEVFGPVLTLTPFDTEEEAIRLANDTPYGLAAYVQSTDEDRLDRVARRLRAGMVQVNGSSRAPGAPFGGVKASGMGREAGLWGIRAFQSLKSISGVAAREQAR